MKHFFIIITVIVASALSAIGQANQAKSIAYYYAAEELYESSNYNEALKQLDRSVEAGGATNATIEALRAQCYAGKKDWIKAKETLDICYTFNPKADILKKLSPIIIIIDDEYENALETERKQKEKIRQNELARQKREHDKKLAAQQLENKMKNIAASLKPKTEKDIHRFLNLEEGRPYLVTYRSSLTSSTNERSVFIFYGEKYIIYTVPSTTITDKLFKDNVSFNGYDANHGDNNVIHMKIKPSYGDKRLTHFKKGIHYSNVFLGGFGDELMWTSGEQRVEFEKTLYYYYYSNTLHCDIELKTSFQEKYYNPYVETGTITKTIDYDLVKNDKLYNKLLDADVDNKSTDINSPEGLVISLVPSSNIKMLYPLKEITYQMKDKLKGEYISGTSEHKGTFLYFVPKTTSSHYGFIQYNKSYPKANLLSSITGLTTSYIISETKFNSLYKSFNENIGNGESRYFTSSDYRTPLEIIPKLIAGDKISLDLLYSTPEKEVEVIEDLNNSNDDVFTVVETMPEFLGGQSALNNYLSNNINYPESAKKDGISGRVFVSFIVNKDGSLGDVKIIKSVNNLLDAEAIRVIKNMPNWKSGTQRGKPVRVSYSMPINFKLL